VCFQETRGSQADIELLRRDDRCRESEVYGSFVDASISGGVVTVVSRKLRACFDTCEATELVRGKILAIHLKGPRGDLVVVNVHMPTTSDPVPMFRRYLEQLRDFLPSSSHTMCLSAGDWNFMEVEEGRFKTDGTWGAGDRGQSDAFAQCCGSWA